MAGPDRPPVRFPKRGLPVSISITIPVKVLIKVRASAPASSTANAISTISVTLGESFTHSGSEVSFLTALTTSKAFSLEVPKAMPPSLTFGQEIFNSKAITPVSFNLWATKAYSSTLRPTIFTTTGIFFSFNQGR